MHGHEAPLQARNFVAGRVSSHRNIPAFTPLMFNATTLQYLSTALLVDSLTHALPSKSLLRPMQLP